PRTPGGASWPRRRFAPLRHSGSAPTPAGRRSPWWGDPSAGRGSPLRRTASRDEGGPSRGTSTTPRCARRSSPPRAGRSRNSRGFLRRQWIRATAVSACRCGMCATTHPGRAPTAGRRCRSRSADAVRLGGAMSHPTPPPDLRDDVVRALTPAFRLDQRVAATPERAVILRRIVPLTLMLELTGRAVITDLRYCNWCLPNVPPEEQGAGGAFVAPEVRTGSPGEPRSDVYGVAALVYYVLTGQEPDLDPARITPPRQLRPAVPAALERVLLRALQAAPGGRYYTATEMLEEFV